MIEYTKNFGVILRNLINKQCKTFFLTNQSTLVRNELSEKFEDNWLVSCW